MGISPTRGANSSEPPAVRAEDAARGSLEREPETKRRLLARFKRIEGQVRGLHRMVDEERYCPEILTQVAAVQSSLRSAAEVVLQDHLRHCVTSALRTGDPAAAEKMYTELTGLFKKFGR